MRWWNWWPTGPRRSGDREYSQVHRQANALVRQCLLKGCHLGVGILACIPFLARPPRLRRTVKGAIGVAVDCDLYFWVRDCGFSWVWRGIRMVAWSRDRWGRVWWTVSGRDMDRRGGEDTSSRFVNVVAWCKNRRNVSEKFRNCPRTPCQLASPGVKDVMRRRDGREGGRKKERNS